MDFDTAVETCLSKCFKFRGRARRAEFWWFVLFCVAVAPLSLILDDLAGNHDEPVVFLIYILAMFLPVLAASVRRLHDRNLSGWWALLYLLPVWGWIPIAILCLLPGTQGANRFGPDHTFRV